MPNIMPDDSSANAIVNKLSSDSHKIHFDETFAKRNQLLQNRTFSHLSYPEKIKYCRLNKKLSHLGWKNAIIAAELKNFNEATNYFLHYMNGYIQTNRLYKLLNKIKGINSQNAEILPTSHKKETLYLTGYRYILGIGVKKNQIMGMQLLAKSAGKGYLPALYDLGLINLKWKNGSNQIRGLELIKIAANKGYDVAQYNLANKYHNGSILTKNLKESLRLCRLSALQGNVYAQYNLGMTYWLDNGAESNTKKAVYWLRLAAEQGHMLAQNNLALAYLYGEGKQKNINRALHWFKQAAKQGDIKAQYKLASLYWQGDDVPQNRRKALFWFKCAAKQGDKHAQFTLGEAYSKGLGVKQSKSRAMFWYRHAAIRAHVYAQYNWGVGLSQGLGVKRNEQKAVRMFQMAAKKGLAEAQYAVGVAYFNGQGIEQNQTEAIQWLTLAADQGLTDAQFNLGIAYFNGLGCNINIIEAYRWLSLAADQGDLEASENMKVVAMLVLITLYKLKDALSDDTIWQGNIPVTMTALSRDLSVSFADPKLLNDLQLINIYQSLCLKASHALKHVNRRTFFSIENHSEKMILNALKSCDCNQVIKAIDSKIQPITDETSLRLD